MSKIREMIRQETIKSFEKDARQGSTESKAVTVRLPVEYVQMVDNLSERLGANRQSLLSDLIISAVEDAVIGYASVFGNPEEVHAEIYRQSGFIDKFPASDYYVFCARNNLDPDSVDSEASFVRVMNMDREERAIESAFYSQAQTIKNDKDGE
ncbi:hypothetical protein [Escherichia coli]|uniref:hypothetical protein n=1 Tax=Escherichia coli TaxID=562 RepID=UPI001365DA25|nr:hypothetical protein [Escherichia coli]MWD87421.1 hypothetical protein [Escherichia coli]